jgi:hypothetical protein
VVLYHVGWGGVKVCSLFLSYDQPPTINRFRHHQKHTNRQLPSAELEGPGFVDFIKEASRNFPDGTKPYDDANAFLKDFAANKGGLRDKISKVVDKTPDFEEYFNQLESRARKNYSSISY